MPSEAIEHENKALLLEALQNLDRDRLEQVEVTRDSLKAYLDKLYGSDGRLSTWSYDWSTRLLLTLGFQNMAEVKSCIDGYGDDRISRMLHGARQGQLTRFEDVLLASMGYSFIMAHPWARLNYGGDPNWFVRAALLRLKRLREGGVSIGSYRPPGYSETLSRSQSDIELIESQVGRT